MSASLKIATALRLKPRERSYFCDLVLLDSQGNDPALQGEIRDRIERQRPRNRAINDLSLDQFRQIADWFHSAILELPLIKGFHLSPENAAVVLGIPRSQAKAAIDRLEKLGLLIKTDAGYERMQTEVRVRSDVRSAALRAFYRQMLKKISVSLEEQTPKERLSGYLTIPFAPEALPEVDQAISRFFDDVRSIAERYENQSQVYHLALHFLNLTSHGLNPSKGASRESTHSTI